MAAYSVDTRGRHPVLIRWDSPYIWTFDPGVEGEWRMSPEKDDMFRGQGDWVWYDDISDDEAEKYMEQIRTAYRTAVEKGELPAEKSPLKNPYEEIETEKRKRALRAVPQRKRPGFLCHIYDMADAYGVKETFRCETVKEYGDSVCLPDGTKLHNNFDDKNYTSPEGERRLVRCNECGALLLIQDTCDPNIYDGFEYLHDWIPVQSEEEADLLNILLTGAEYKDYPYCHIQLIDYNDCRWTDGEEPVPNDPEVLKKKIRMKYADVNPDQLELLINGAGKNITG